MLSGEPHTSVVLVLDENNEKVKGKRGRIFERELEREGVTVKERSGRRDTGRGRREGEREKREEVGWQ